MTRKWLFAGILTAAGAVFASGLDFYEKDLATALEKAKKEGKPVLLNFGGEW